MPTARACILALTLLAAALPVSADNTVAAAAGFALVEGGTYVQGDERGSGAADERPTRTVTLRSFLLARAETTFEQYDRFTRETGRPAAGDNGWGREDRPVISVSWLDAVEYCNWLSSREGYRPVYRIEGATVTTDWSADGYRLPTESEWEYAARGGRAGASSGEPAAIVGWHVSTAGARTHPVAGLAPNALGLYDMAGNVWEWCNDWYGPYMMSSAIDPRGPEDGQRRVLRGGSWYDPPFGLRSAARNRQPPALRLPIIGFRVARTAG